MWGQIVMKDLVGGPIAAAKLEPGDRLGGRRLRRATTAWSTA